MLKQSYQNILRYNLNDNLYNRVQKLILILDRNICILLSIYKR